MIKTPCIGRCTCTLGDEVCKGCGRTADQVRDWNGYTEEKKAAVIKECKKSPAGMTEPTRL